MRRINEHDINRIVKKILLEDEQSEIWIQGKSVKINPSNNNQIIIDNKYTFKVDAKKGWNDYQPAHIINITGWDKGVTINTEAGNELKFNEEEVKEVFTPLIKGEDFEYEYITYVYIRFTKV